MNTKQLLEKEIQDELEEIGGMEIGSEAHKAATETLTKLLDKYNDIDKLDLEYQDKYESRENDRIMKEQQAEFLNDVSHANTEHFQNGLTQNIQVLTGKNCKNITTSGLYYMSGGTYRPVNVDGWLEVMKYDANTVAQIYTTKTGQKYVRYMKNGIWDNNWRGGMSNVEKLWSGTLSKGGKVTIANLDLYDTFILGCSNGTAMLIGTRYYDPSGNRGTTVLFSTAHDDGTEQ